MILRIIIVVVLMSLSFGAGYIASYNARSAENPSTEGLTASSAQCEKALADITEDLAQCTTGKPQRQTIAKNNTRPSVQPPREQKTQEQDYKPPTSITTLADLKTYLDAVSDENYNVSLVIDFINRSPEGLDYIISQYRSIDNATLKQFLREVLSSTDRPAKIDFALELLNSRNAEDRSDAYSWLEQSEAFSQGEVYQSLLEASYFEEDPEALAGLIAIISSPEGDDENLRASAISRLNELAYHENPEIASQALSSVSALTQDDATLNILKTHLFGSSERLKIAALNGLYYFHNADDSLIESVEKIAQDSSSSRDVKNLASDLVNTLREVAKLQELERQQE